MTPEPTLEGMLSHFDGTWNYRLERRGSAEFIFTASTIGVKLSFNAQTAYEAVRQGLQAIGVWKDANG